VKRLLFPFSLGFRAGIELRRIAYRHGIFKTHRLNRPVVSVGNLTVGGTGKTPLVWWIAERLLDLGWSPSVLTRGYRRRIGGMIVLPPENRKSVNPRDVGDEVALLARALPKVPIVVNANRYRAGRLAEERFTVDVHLLDDGFQHWSLARAVDVVAMDVTEDPDQAALLPAGRFREPFSALKRANIIVLTRTGIANPIRHREAIAHVNPRAEIYQASLALRGLIDVRDDSVHSLEELQSRRALVFCGIGNPRAFGANLQQWGMDVIKEVAYRDHHAYGAGELHRLEKRARAQGADILVTTEKDWMNFPAHWTPGMPVFACSVRLEVQDAAAFEKALIQGLRSVKVPA
jgi:tetraacyldisaccharide 4'-kinase